mmetsp:Transcript_18683/g.59536  ORF Transcript_18683/g.59536 Transcript_18683/m.59536 type:complete len:221 (-) Transcript_18683:954-1616(-)
MSAGMPRHSTMATRCSSPPDRYLTSWSSSGSRLSGLVTSVVNCGCIHASRSFLSSSDRTEPSARAEIFCGLYDTFISGTPSAAALSVSPLSSAATCSSLLSRPASMRMKVVLPVPFSPSSTMISDCEKEPPLTCSLKERFFFLPTSVLVMSGYVNVAPPVADPVAFSSAVCASLKLSASSRKRMFSVGTKPARNTLMPSRTEKGMVTTPYAPGTPYRQQM